MKIIIRIKDIKINEMHTPENMLRDNTIVNI